MAGYGRALNLWALSALTSLILWWWQHKTILLSPQRKRVPYCRAFDAAAGHDVEIRAADAVTPTPPALSGRGMQPLGLPSGRSRDWANQFLRLCRDNKFSLIVSVADRELSALTTVVSDLERLACIPYYRGPQALMAICGDKRLFVQWCTQSGFPTQRLFHWEATTLA